MRAVIFATVFCALVALSSAQWGFPRTITKNGGNAVFLGDETTVDGGYIRYLKDFLGKASSAYSVNTVGVRGATINQFLRSNEFRNFQNTKPDYVFVFLGKNDGRLSSFKYDNVKRDFDNILRKINALETRPIIFAITPSAVYDNRLGLDASTINIRVSEIISDVARSNRAILIDDVASATAGHQDWFPDGVHPNDNGSKAIAEVIYETLKKMSPNSFMSSTSQAPRRTDSVRSDRPGNNRDRDRIRDNTFRPRPNVAYRILFKLNKNLALTVQSKSRSNVLVLDQYADKAEQKWYFTDSVANGWTIQTVSGKNLQAGSQGKQVTAESISHDNKQDWTFVADNKGTGAFSIVNVATRLALDNTKCSQNKGNPVQVWASAGNDCQTWVIEEAN